MTNRFTQAVKDAEEKNEEILDISDEYSHNPILITDYKYNMNNWVASIKGSLPEILEDSLIFSLYQNPVKENCLDCVITNNNKTKHDLVDYSNDTSLFNVFDFTKAIGHKLITNSSYSKLVQVGYLLNDSKFQKFKSFFNQFQYKNLDSDIDSCLMLFYLTLTGVEILDNESIVMALDFAKKYETIYIDNNLFNKLNVSVNIDKEMAVIFARFMFKVSKTSKEKSYFSKTYTFVFDYIQKLLQDCNENDISTPYDFYNNIKLMEYADIEELFDFVLSNETISKLSKFVTNADTKFAKFYLPLVLQLIKLKDNKWPEDLQYIALIEYVIDILINDFEALKSIFINIGDNLEYVSNLLLICYKKSISNDLIKKQLVEFALQLEKGKIYILTFMLESVEGSMLVYDEFKESLLQSENKVDFFWEFKSKIFDKNNTFSDIYFSESVYFYLNHIKGTSLYKDECTNILNLLNNNQIVLSDEVLTYFVNEFENEVPLVVTDIVTRVALKDIFKIKKSRKIITSNTNDLLMEFIKSLEVCENNKLLLNLISTRLPALNGISVNKANDFIHRCLDILTSSNFVNRTVFILFYIKCTESLGEELNKFEETINSLDELPKFSSTRLSSIVELYINLMDENNYNNGDCLKILALLVDRNIQIKKELLIHLITNYENSISLITPSKKVEDSIGIIINFKKDFYVTTFPDISNIASFNIKLRYLESKSQIIDLLTTSTLNLKGMNEEKYSKYIEWCLPFIGSKINVIDYADILSDAFYLDEFKDRYLIIYCEILIGQINAGSAALSKDQMLSLIKSHKNSLNIVVNLITLYFNKCLGTASETEAIELFTGIVDESVTFNLTPLEIRKFFSENVSGNELLFEEFKYRFRNSNNKTDFYTKYWNESLDGLNNYKNSYLPESIDIYLQEIQYDNNYSIACYDILVQIKKERILLTEKLLTDIVSICEKIIPLVSPSAHEKDILRNISEIKAERNISTSPDIIGFINLGEKLESISNKEEMRQFISNTSLDKNNIDFSRYEEWLELCIPKVIGTANTWQMHSYIKKVLCEDNLKGIFFTKYVGMLSDELNKTTSEAYEIFIQFIIYFINAKKEIGEENFIQIRSNIVSILLRFTKSKLSEIDKLLCTALASSRSKELIINEWRQIQKKVTPVAKLEKGFLSKVFKK